MTEKKYIDRDALINDFESDLIIRMFYNLKGSPRPRAIDIAVPPQNGHGFNDSHFSTSDKPSTA